MNLVPGLSLRATEEDEVNGIDDAELGEFAYDYVELRRETNAIIFGEEAIDSKNSGDHSGREAAMMSEKVC